MTRLVNMSKLSATYFCYHFKICFFVLQKISENGAVIQTFSGFKDPFTFTSSSSQVQLVFTSDDNVTYQGFTANIVQGRCFCKGLAVHKRGPQSGEGRSFLRFCADIYYERPLNCNKKIQFN